MAAKVAAMNHAGDLLAALDLLHGHVVGLGLKNQPVHRMDIAARLAAVVGRQRDGVALPLGGQRLGVRRELAANAVGIRRQEGRAQPVAQIAEVSVLHVEHLLRPGLVVLTAARVRVTTFWPPISVTAWAWPARAVPASKGSEESAQTK